MGDILLCELIYIWHPKFAVDGDVWFLRKISTMQPMLLSSIILLLINLCLFE